MNISVCITVLNEEESVGRLLDSLLAQTKRPDEIVIVDGGSSDHTIEIINHYQRRFSKVKLLKEKCTRAKGRNLSIEIAKSQIVAMTDAGCVAHKNWLSRITEPFRNEEVGVAAGFYDMVYRNNFEQSESIFLGVTPNKFDISFLPSTRSVAFRKSIWEKVGGFPENINDTAEDTVFNYRLLTNSVKIARVKNARVGWGMPKSLKEFFLKIFSYAKGDAQTKIFYFPTKGIMSHNIKAIFVLVRYVLGIVLLFLSFNYSPLLLWILILLFLYVLWSYKKAKFWGIILQFTSDFAVMSGFLMGLMGR